MRPQRSRPVVFSPGGCSAPRLFHDSPERRHEGVSAGCCHAGVSAGCCHAGVSADCRQDGVSAGCCHDGVSAGCCQEGVSAGCRHEGVDADGCCQDGVCVDGRCHDGVCSTGVVARRCQDAGPSLVSSASVVVGQAVPGMADFSAAAAISSSVCQASVVDRHTCDPVDERHSVVCRQRAPVARHSAVSVRQPVPSAGNAVRPVDATSDQRLVVGSTA
ncbi:hypothetical protein AMIS_80860 [Actinoplanes missouriensis 431]|uniref:Uncharacterized protein n=1 Tax=Actinoplanes missouriensis (strain ATCC 14538 / DSM 43046 / CBS 188.64 / JCM 3121 / NBRC 102363 / NCIMB 12654 / NRRL B-3342 / UNCC 431) TaxID=512565 RepID=I0HJW9_ACTM4|nr:hypothetical protein AMIS_80860 [Actinoplanes missouriensis 431]